MHNSDANTRDKRYAQLSEKLSAMAASVQDWISGRVKQPVMQSTDSYLEWSDHSATAEQLRRHALGLELDIVSHDMAHVRQRMYAGTSRSRLKERIVRDLSNVALLQTPTRAYAFIRCVFTGVNYGMDQAECLATNTFLHNWLPYTAGQTLAYMSTPNDLADMLFGAVWRTLYDIDFNNLYPEELDALLLTQPPLYQDLTPKLNNAAATLPPQLLP